MQDTAATTPEGRRYPLVQREDGRIVLLVVRDEGIVLDRQGISWTADGLEQRRGWRDVTSVRLWTTAASGRVGLCRIEFNRGPAVTVSSATPAGFADAERTDIYHAFLRDLHRTLPAMTTHPVQYQAGDGGGAQRQLLQIGVVLLGLLCVVLPIGLLIFTFDLRALFWLLGGIAIIVPMTQMLRNNEPGSYEPHAIPDQVLP